VTGNSVTRPDSCRTVSFAFISRADCNGRSLEWRRDGSHESSGR
jgi:hypothetical protein